MSSFKQIEANRRNALKSTGKRDHMAGVHGAMVDLRAI